MQSVEDRARNFLAKKIRRRIFGRKLLRGKCWAKAAILRQSSWAATANMMRMRENLTFICLSPVVNTSGRAPPSHRLAKRAKRYQRPTFVKREKERERESHGLTPCWKTHLLRVTRVNGLPREFECFVIQFASVLVTRKMT